jgi:hypothetical protein
MIDATMLPPDGSEAVLSKDALSQQYFQKIARIR